MPTEVWSDLSDKLITDSSGMLKKSINVDAVKVSINNILGTMRGERIFLPQFGGSLDDLVFEPINTYLTDRIITRIKNEIEIWDDRVIVVSINIDTDPDHNAITVQVNFNIKSYQETFTNVTTLTV